MTKIPRELPRDLNAGVMAAQLFESGVFGEELDFCVALAWDGAYEQLRFGDETSCCEELLQRFNAGDMVSDYEYCSKRVSADQDAHAVEREMIAAAVAALSAPFEAQVSAFQARAFENREDAFAAYFESLPAGEAMLVNGLLGMGLQRKLISREFADTWRQPEPELTGKRFAGFAYKKDGAIATYVNAYLPDVWRQWRKTPEASAIFVGAVKGTGSIPQLRQQFEDRLAGLIDERYFALLEA